MFFFTRDVSKTFTFITLVTITFVFYEIETKSTTYTNHTSNANETRHNIEAFNDNISFLKVSINNETVAERNDKTINNRSEIYTRSLDNRKEDVNFTRKQIGKELILDISLETGLEPNDVRSVNTLSSQLSDIKNTLGNQLKKWKDLAEKVLNTDEELTKKNTERYSYILTPKKMVAFRRYDTKKDFREECYNHFSVSSESRRLTVASGSKRHTFTFSDLSHSINDITEDNMFDQFIKKLDSDDG